MSQQAARPYIGGQAVIEGVMMRSPGSVAIVCRRRSGELIVRERPVPVVKGGARSLPFLRGVASVVESLRLGTRALRWSAELYEQDAQLEDGAPPPPRSGPKTRGVLSALAIGVSALVTRADGEGEGDGGADLGPDGAKKGSLLGLLPILFAVVLFVAMPQAAAEGVNRLFKLGLEVTSPGYQAITGACKLTIVVGYLLMIRRLPEVRRVFQFHGAEHKAISTYEATEDLLVENARRKTTMHPRCGTTFLVMVALVSIVMFTGLGAVLPKPPGGRLVESLGFFLIKLPFLPVIASVTFEIQRLFARYCTTGPLRALLWPGFLVQKITTAEPDDTQLEVALASLKATLWREARVEAPAPADRVFADYDSLNADPGYAAARS